MDTLPPDPHAITTLEQLEAIYGPVREVAAKKVTPKLDQAARLFIAASPFCLLATSGPKGSHCTPRGDAPGLPDRRGNNRLDTLRNLVRDPRIALLFLTPGVNRTLRVNGRAAITTDPDLCASFTMEGKAPKSVIVVTAERVYTQCPKALVRSHLWDPAKFLAENDLPSSGTIMHALQASFDAEEYDRAYPQRLRETIY